MSQVPKPAYIPNIGTHVTDNNTFGGETADALAVTDWQDLALITGWTPYESGWGHPQISKDRSGWVRMRGLANVVGASLAAYTDLAVLPTGYWPEINMMGLANMTGGIWEWQATSGGKLSFRQLLVGAYSSGLYWSFSGITWWAPPQ